MTRWIYTCPDCEADLTDEGFSLWCPRCDRPVPYDIAGPDPDAWRDHIIDLKEASSEF